MRCYSLAGCKKNLLRRWARRFVGSIYSVKGNSTLDGVQAVGGGMGLGVQTGGDAIWTYRRTTGTPCDGGSFSMIP